MTEKGYWDLLRRSQAQAAGSFLLTIPTMRAPAQISIDR
jgi:hypothetical protein